MIKAILFDLDGTLLPMDPDVFVQFYFKKLAKKLAPFGYDPEQLPKSLWKGVAAMVMNDGHASNETVFWEAFQKIYGEAVINDKHLFEEFYANEFQSASKVCGFEPMAKKCVNILKAKGFRIILATNPIFPGIATESRMRWAGFSPEDFEFYTIYENSSYSKPNPEYYHQILLKQDLKPEECLMVGNDVDEDMIAETLGMKVFLLTDCLINKQNKDITCFPNGSFKELLEYVESIA